MLNPLLARGVMQIVTNPGVQRALSEYLRSPAFQQHVRWAAKKAAEEMGQRVVEGALNSQTPKQSLLNLLRGE
jgi:hypothetical protein